MRGCLEGVTTVQSYAKLMHLETAPRVDRPRADVLKPIQWQRRILVRWEYHAQNFLGFVQLACLVILFRRF